jgi:hypothetical protein
MKRFMKIAALAFVIVLGSAWRNDATAQQPYDYDSPGDAPYSEDEVSYQTFYDELSPHGRWIDHPEYGYVWTPNAGPDFRPYATSGHWVWTEEYEWMWVSDYDWGWAPFHYGRWDNDPYYGWFWVPGYEWSPAWVAWRDGGDYYGWAPVRPGISINISIGSYAPPYDFWCFTPRRYITYRNVWDHCLDRRRNVTIINHTTIINNYNYRGNIWRTGPRRVDVEIYAGRITPVRFRPSSRPGRSIFRNNEVNIYRPNVRRDNNRRFTPRSVERYDRQRANDNRIGRNDNNRFDRNNGNNNRRIEGNSTRIDRNNGNNNNNRRLERNDARVERDRPANPGNDRRFERNDNSNNNNNRVIERRRQMEAPGNNRSVENDRRVFRQQQGTNGNNDSRRFEQRRIERNNQPEMRQPQQQQPQRREIRTQENNNRQVSPQQRQQQPRQFERRESSRPAGEQNGNGNGRGRGRGRD